MAIAKHTKGARARTGKAPTKPRPDLDAILGRFNDALAIVKVVGKALEGAEFATESCALDAGILALEAVYTELDLAIGSAK